MSDKTLLLPSDSYNPSHERMRNRRIEEVMRRSEVNFNDLIRSMFVPACNVADLSTSERAGTRGFALDSNTSTYNAPVVGGGNISVPIFFDGTIWRVG